MKYTESALISVLPPWAGRCSIWIRSALRTLASAHSMQRKTPRPRPRSPNPAGWRAPRGAGSAAERSGFAGPRRSLSSSVWRPPATANQPTKPTPQDHPGRLRAAALDRRLTGEELARTLFHIVKHRGFKSNRKNAQDAEDGKMLAGIGSNKNIRAECVTAPPARCSTKTRSSPTASATPTARMTKHSIGRFLR